MSGPGPADGEAPPWPGRVPGRVDHGDLTAALYLQGHAEDGFDRP
ncbi:hypothetical protein [uncultured Serinicoccus sp.]|nr:hypothetical protein [uncultured Serinicoccus sp.]